MRICIDARCPQYGGPFNYTVSLLEKLLELDGKNEYLILYDALHGELGFNHVQERIVPSLNPIRWILWNELTLPTLLRKENIDIYHSLRQLSMFSSQTKKVFTFHTAAQWLFPTFYPWYVTFYWSKMRILAARRATLVIAVSEIDKDHIVERTNISNSKVRVTYLAPNERFKTVYDQHKLRRVKNKYNLPDQFVLFVGNIQPFKNLETLIRAFAVVKNDGKIRHKIVIVGKPSWFYQKVFRLVNDLEITAEVIFLGYIYDDLPSIYTLADLFLLPSIYEAFPVTPLEAMACGTPVIASNAGGLPEVVGDAGVFVNPYDFHELAAAITLVLNDSDLRETLVQQGFKRSTMFSWIKTAQQTLQIYEDVYNI